MNMSFDNHAPDMRRANNSAQYLDQQSSTNFNLQLPLSDSESINKPNHHVSYFESISVPTTPSIFTRFPCPKKLRSKNLLTSKSSSNLHTSKIPWSGISTPGSIEPRRGKLKYKPDLNILSKDKSDSDWLLRTGAFMASTARESKGQSWLLSRASSTSLTRIDDDDDEWEQTLSRERPHHSLHTSFLRNTTRDLGDESCPRDIRKISSIYSGSQNWSQTPLRSGSRQRLLDSCFEPDGYFDYHSYDDQTNDVPQYYDTEIMDSSIEDIYQQDEVAIKALAKAYSQGVGGWIESLLGWSLFSAEDDTEEPEPDSTDDEYYEVEFPTSNKSTKDADQIAENDVVSPNDGEATVWQDAVWLLTTAGKVLF